MFAQERHSLIKKIVRKQRRMSFLELLHQVKVSPATLRRDLTDLEAAGEIIRVHGGVLDPSYVRTEVSFDERLVRNSTAKRSIATMAAAMVPSGATIFVDAGSTCLEVGKLLISRKDVRIVTHSLALLEAGLRGEAEMLCIGGVLRKVSGALTGGPALDALSRLNAEIAFMGASGFDENGPMTTELSEAEMKQAIMRRATRTVLVADSTKWNQPSTVRFAVWKDLSEWITDQLPPRKEMSGVISAGLKMSRAKS